MQNLYYQLYLSYLETRKNKRNTNNQLAFEIDVETKLYALAEQIQNRTYTPKSSIAFMVYKPVQREIYNGFFLYCITFILNLITIYEKDTFSYFLINVLHLSRSKFNGNKRWKYHNTQRQLCFCWR